MTCQRRSGAAQRLRNQAGLMVPAISMFMGDHTMAMTATERSRVLRERRARGKVVLTVAVGESELAEIARAGYAEAAGDAEATGKQQSTCSSATRSGD
jgi:hypothetical protein